MHQENQVERVHPVFFQFGFGQNDIVSQGHQAIGRCPFCGSNDHFFINKTSINSTWDCKKCGRSGGYKRFIESIIKHCQKNFTESTAIVLCQSRSLRYETFRTAGVGYHKLTNQYIVPTLNGNDEVLSAKIFSESSFKVVAGQTLTMYTPTQSCSIVNAKIIFICEGEWDTLTMVEILKSLKIKDQYALGVPGAGTFKHDFLPALSGKHVVLLYDNDDAGRMGKDKAVKLLGSIAASLKSIEWPQDTDDGFDIRDLYIYNKCNAKQTYDYMIKLIKSVQVIHTTVVTHKGQPPSCQKVYSVFRKWLYLPSTEMLDVIFGTVLSNQLAGDPLWMFIVAPPGGTKTEPLLSLSNGSMIETVSTLTSRALISGAPMIGGQDPSLIPRLNEKVLVIKDFTSILGINPQERDAIFTILRDAYDGECKKSFGNSVVRSYKSRFSVLAAVTPVIETFTEDNTALGERFLRWKNELPISMSKRIPYIEKALSNVTKEKLMRAELCEIADEVLNAKYDGPPEIPNNIAKKIISLSQITSLLRATVHRNKYSKEIEHNSFYELSTRISKELYKLLYGVAMFRQRKVVTDQEYAVAVHVSRASVTSRLFDTIQIIYEEDFINVSDLSERIRLPIITCRTILENLFTIFAVKRTKIEGSTGYQWSLSDELKEQIEQSNFCRRRITHGRKTRE